jgi:hypothetical protein
MKFYSALKIGDYHQNHCEDHLCIREYGKKMFLCAVMDGCTTALESHFASTLVGKILNKICKEKGYKEFVEQDNEIVKIEGHLKLILQDLLTELKNIQNTLHLDYRELLTTLIIMLFDKDTQEGIILIIGDGFVNVNGKTFEFEQDNKPDYLGFHLSDDFETFYHSQQQKIYFDKIADITISTDGIFTFEKLKSYKSSEDINVTEFLTIEKTGSESDEMLNLKLKILENNYGLIPCDDFSLIRVIK